MEITARELLRNYCAKMLEDVGLTEEGERLRAVQIPYRDGGPGIQVGHARDGGIFVDSLRYQAISDGVLTRSAKPGDHMLFLMINVPVTIDMHGLVKLEKVP